MPHTPRTPDRPIRSERRTRHHRRAAAAGDARAAAERRSRALSVLRLMLAIGGLLGLLWAIDPASPFWAWGVVGLSGLGFLVAVVVHERVEREVRYHGVVVDVHRQAVARLDRDWDALARTTRPAPAAPTGHAYAHDLDVCGRASLFGLLDPGGSEDGRKTLAAWLLAPAPADEVASRQVAVAELAALGAFREALAVKSRLFADDRRLDLARFLEWAEADEVPVWTRHVGLVAVARSLGLATPVLVAANWWGLVPATPWLLTLAVGLGLTWRLRRPIAATFASAASASAAVGAWADLLGLVATARFEAPALRELQHGLDAGTGRPADDALRRLERWAALADLRHSPLVHLPVHLLTLWDVHVWWGLERWRRTTGPFVRRWLTSVGRCEALAALATLADDEPAWSMPRVDPLADRLDAAGLGHPLIPDAVRVVNDVAVGPAGTVLLVTGSNMSGKSTLLRAIGLNAVLAQAGGPVCATTLSMPPADVFTSMRLSDSLEAGVSYFMAALRRLRVLVDAAGPIGPSPDEGRPRRAGPGTRRVVYLLDEILQGTNTAEREVAVRVILGHLLRTPSLGAVTTHDLGLVTAPELAGSACLVHFTEAFGEPEGHPTMTFDYRLRPGVATSRNALRLMQLVGLASPDEVQAAAGGPPDEVLPPVRL